MFKEHVRVTSKRRCAGSMNLSACLFRMQHSHGVQTSSSAARSIPELLRGVSLGIIGNSQIRTDDRTIDLYLFIYLQPIYPDFRTVNIGSKFTQSPRVAILTVSTCSSLTMQESTMHLAQSK